MPTIKLTADCASCAALCCVVYPLDAGEEFGHSKPAGAPCRHLCGARCSIHAQLVERGYSGCAAYDCFGAGQRATQSFADSLPGNEELRARVFLKLREVHALLLMFGPDEELEALAAGPVDALLEANLQTESRRRDSRGRRG